MVQLARPDSDISAGLWEPVGGPSSLFDAINEVTANDSTDYIEALNGEDTTCELGLSNITDPVSSVGHIIRFRMQGTGSGGPERCMVQLFDGGSLIADTGSQTSRAAWNTKVYELTTTEADNIGSYTDLRFKITSSNLGGTEDMWVTWAEFEVPDAAGDVTGSGSPQAVTATTTAAGVNKNLGSGSPQADVATSSGAAVQKHIGTGTSQAETATAAGFAVGANFAVGSPQAQTATASGAGVNTNNVTGSPQADTATASGSGTVPGGGPPPLEGIPVGFYSIPNCVKDPDFIREMRKEAEDITPVWCIWVASVELPTNPVPKRTSNLNLDIALIQNEAEGIPTWARWAPGVQAENTGKLQLNMRLAIAANFVLSV